MAILNQAKYLSFDHLYAETVVVTDVARIQNGVAAHRFVKRTGGYPAAAGEYAAGVTIFDIYGVNSLTGYPQIDLTKTTFAVTATTGAVAGTGTAFTTELSVGAVIRVVDSVNGTTDLVVSSITSDTVMVVEGIGGAAVPAIANANITSLVRLEAKGGYSVDSSGLNLDYQDRMNTSNTPLAPFVFPYQKNLTVVTAGICIVTVAPSQTFTVDAPVYSDTSGRASTTAGAGVILGRSLDAITTGANDSAFIRVKLAGVAN